MDGGVATVTAKAEKETKETGYDCLRRLICYILASIYEFLLMCQNTNIGNYFGVFFAYFFCLCSGFGICAVIFVQSGCTSANFGNIKRELRQDIVIQKTNLELLQ